MQDESQERNRLIDRIQQLFPADSENQLIAETGTDFIVTAFLDVYDQWRELPMPVLREYAQHCEDLISTRQGRELAEKLGVPPEHFDGPSSVSPVG